MSTVLRCISLISTRFYQSMSSFNLWHATELTRSSTFSSTSSFPKLIPIMVGNTSAASEKAFGQLLAPYLQDPSNVFVVSSDFAHWGSRFRYTYYLPSSTPSSEPINIRSNSEVTGQSIHESIKHVDFECIGACEGGKHDDWLGILEKTGNTVCGRHPIGIVMAAMESLGGGSRFKFVKYDRSSNCEKLSDSSVSYCSAFAVV